MDGQKCEIDRLPEACVSHVLSLTSPRDSCRAAVLSSTFRQAADSNTVWSRFLPSDYREILSRTVDSVSFSSCKELYFKLCDSVLIDRSKKAISLEKETGAKCFTLHPKKLYLPWADDQGYWRWVFHPDSSFMDKTLLSEVCWIEIQCGINCRELSPNTTYKSYLVFKIPPEANRLRYPTQEVSVKLGTQISKGKTCLNPNKGEGRISRRELPPEVRVPRPRSDGWMEVDLGEFYTEDGSEGDVSISFKYLRNTFWIRSIIVQGIQFRPN